MAKTAPPRERSLRWHLTALSVGLLLPTLLFIGVLLVQLAAAERKAVEAQARDLSSNFAVVLDREINGVLTTLQALSTSPSLQGDDLAGFYRQAQDVSRLQGINISLRDAAGHTLLNTRVPFGAPLPTAAVPAQADREVLRTGKAAVTDIFTGAITGKPAFQVIGAPVTVAGKAAFLLAASLDLAYLAEAIRRENLPPGWIGTIADRNGIIVARTQRHAEFAGRPVSAEFTAHAVGPVVSYYGHNVEGTATLVGIARSPLTGWSAGANIAVATVNAPLHRSLVALAGLGLALGVIATVLGWATRRLFTGAFNSLAAVADAVGQGRSVDPVATPVAELNRVGSALRAAAERRREAEDALRQLAGTLEAKVAERTADLSRAQRQLRDTNRNLEALVEARVGELKLANDEIQRFATIVSHDLRAPLVNVLGFTSELEALRDDLALLLSEAESRAPGLVTAERRRAIETDLPEALGFIRASTQKMDRLIGAILKMSREGRRKLVPEPIDVAALVEAQGRSLAQQLAARKAEVLVEGALPSLDSDRLAVEQIFGNLVENAVKYLTTERPGRIVVSGQADGPMLRYAVADNGRGIEPKDFERIFELFRRAGEQDTPGEGIGLATVRNLARRLGGNVAVSSVPGKGSTFTVTLPARPGSQQDDERRLERVG